MNQDETFSSEQKQPERAIQSIGQEPDLTEFTSTVVDDLRAPLRSLNRFTELLTQEYQNELDEKAQQYLDCISDSSSRMKTLIEDLSTYSLAGTEDQTWITVDLNQIVTQVQSDLHLAIAQTEAKFIVHDLPQLLINPQEIYQLWKNLIKNAIKYHGKQNPLIEIRAVAQQQEWLFAIADNGIGIAAESQSRIFDAFQRLHPVEVYSGSGLGLAICQKIVRRYGGKLWVESSSGQGSTFYFTLPIDIYPQIPSASIE